ncbi:MAG: hypothetical protein KGD60_14135, partial [Candidatus Thorarchaeota archaeon]|nr:hypothetical protein [Candidatus Thorarchaeota archaeon]
SCGGFFEFMPGFGAFTLPDQERRGSVRHEGSSPRTSFDVYEAEAPWKTERPPAPGNNCGTYCFILCCLCFIIPVILFIMMIVFGFGLFW